jgi:hypothetical protein
VREKEGEQDSGVPLLSLHAGVMTAGACFGLSDCRTKRRVRRVLLSVAENRSGSAVAAMEVPVSLFFYPSPHLPILSHAPTGHLLRAAAGRGSFPCSSLCHGARQTNGGARWGRSGVAHALACAVFGGYRERTGCRVRCPVPRCGVKNAIG